jgi:hydroxypyruvate isomerase
MLKSTANVSTMYTEHAFLDRFAAAASDGFRAVEFQFGYEHPRADIAARLRDSSLQLVLLNAPAGRVAQGERGWACLQARRDEFRRSLLERALPYAMAPNCPRVHVMCGVMPPDVERARLRAVCVANLEWAAREAASVGVELVIEPLNPRDNPGYLLQRPQDAHDIVQEVAAPNLRVQMDLYHCQIVEGDVTTKLRTFLPTRRVGHLQIAGVPDRHEPDLGERHHDRLWTVIEELGWDGYAGCEYRPRERTSQGLGWLRSYQAHAAQGASL